MNHLTQILRANDGLILAAALSLGYGTVLTILAFILRSAGASLRPIVFMAVLFAPLGFTFILVGLIRAREPGPPPPPPSAGAMPLAERPSANLSKFFGPDIPVAQIQDAKPVFPEILGQAEAAQLGIVGNGETVLVADFASAEQAKQAAAAYWRIFSLTQTSGDEHRGWRGKRGVSGDYVEMLRTGGLLLVWTALAKDACAQRRAATPITFSGSDALLEEARPLVPSLQPLGAFLRQPVINVAGVVLLVLIYVGWFFKGAGWAGSVPGEKVAPVAANELAKRLEGINQLDVPFHIQPGSQANEFYAAWRYAEAKWIDSARTHGVRRAHRIRLQLDPQRHTVRATDYFSSLDWSAGAAEASVAWKTGLGITFFQFEHQRVYGLQIAADGRLTPAVSYAYTFNLRELKSPLIATVTQAGWTWRPTVWQGPSWLAWLTE